MTYEFADQFTLFQEAAYLAIGTEELAQQFKKGDGSVTIEDMIATYLRFRNAVQNLSDIRTRNGFSRFENKTLYGGFVAFCYRFSFAIQAYMVETETLFKLREVNKDFLLAGLVQKAEELKFMKEMESEEGPNSAVYFGPQVDLEGVKDVIRANLGKS